MLHEADGALRALLRAGLPGGTAISFAAPDPSMAQTGTVDVFLHRIREDGDARLGWWSEVRNDANRVVERRPAERSYRLWYLLTAWCADVEAEHALLGAALASLAPHDAVPAEHLTGSLAEVTHPVQLRVAPGDQPGPGPEFWAAMGIRPKAVLDVVLTVPLPPAAITDLAERPATIDLGVDGRYRGRPGERTVGGRPARRLRERP